MSYLPAVNSYLLDGDTHFRIRIEFGLCVVHPELDGFVNDGTRCIEGGERRDYIQQREFFFFFDRPQTNNV